MEVKSSKGGNKRNKGGNKRNKGDKANSRMPTKITRPLVGTPISKFTSLWVKVNGSKKLLPCRSLSDSTANDKTADVRVYWDSNEYHDLEEVNKRFLELRENVFTFYLSIY
jgi:hypothetical protein